MLYYKNYTSHDFEIKGKKKQYDSTIYTFDIETTSFIIDKRNNNIYPAVDYLSFKDIKNCDEFIDYGSCMYIWMLGINEDVYFGRTWEELDDFLNMINNVSGLKKYFFVHNLSYEFQFFRKYFKIGKVLSRKTRKVMRCTMLDYNIEFRCTYYMSNTSLEKLADDYDLDIKKLTGNLDYDKLRNPFTVLDDKELSYCENDCLVVYKYIIKELDTYKELKNLPLTSTGHVRKDLKRRVLYNRYYTSVVSKAVNIDPHIYNLLVDAFAGGYTHGNYYYVDEILEALESYDYTSSYPYVMVTHKFPMTKFRKCDLQSLDDLNPHFGYLLVLHMENGRSSYFNTFLSSSKVKNLRGATYDNGRLIKFSECDYICTDIDAKIIKDCYNKDGNLTITIKEAYYSKLGYLPKSLINFILDKYEDKTKYKNVPGKESVYALAKSLFNSIFGMTVTNEIRADVEYCDDWMPERDLSNEEIIEKLLEQEKRGFLSFSWGVWVTAYARNNLIRNIMKLDEYAVYSDTDSIKLLPGFNKQVIIDYNNYVKIKIKKASDDLKIPYDRFQPVDCKGEKHLLGLFDHDASYTRFITQGAKKYAYEYIDKDGTNKMGITVSGVPKCGVKCLSSLEDFRDGFTFTYDVINKHMISYIDEDQYINLVDYQGHEYLVKDKSGACLLPTNYTLGKSEIYNILVQSSDRSTYKVA